MRITNNKKIRKHKGSRKKLLNLEQEKKIHVSRKPEAICFEVSVYFFRCYLVAPWPTLGYNLKSSVNKPMLITVFLDIQPDVG